MRRPVLLALLLALAWASAQSTFTIGLDEFRSGTIPTMETTHEYALVLPAGVAGVTIAVDAGGLDADLAVYGPNGEELYYDISSDPYPTAFLTAPLAGRYRIEVKNLLFQPLPYTLSVTRTGAARPTQPTPEGWTIALGDTRSGTVPADEIDHTYLLDLPAGVASVTITVNGMGRDADLAVYGPLGDELVNDLSIEPNPTVTFDALPPGRYRIEVKNLYFEPLDYVLTVTGSATRGPIVTPPPVTPPVVTPPPVTPPVTPPIAPPPSVALSVECTTTAHRGDIAEVALGASIVVRCPAGCGDAGLWGTDLYTDDSAVCRAAQHAGVIGVGGGLVEIRITQGAANHPGSTRNGVTSRTWGSWDRSFTVAIPGGSTVTPPTSGASLRPLASTPAPGAPIDVAFAGAPGNARDWIGLYRDGESGRAYLAYLYTDGATDGTLTFTAPDEPGRYQFRLYENDGYVELAASTSFEVVPAATALRVANTRVSVGSTVVVEFVGAPGTDRDWIGLYREGAVDRGYLTWQYTGGATAGSLTFILPEAGRFEFRLYENDGFERLVSSPVIEVVP